MPSISTTLSALAVATGAEGDDDDEVDDCCIVALSVIGLRMLLA